MSDRLWMLCPLCKEVHKLPVLRVVRVGDTLRQQANCAKARRNFWKVTVHPTAPPPIRRVYVEMERP